MMNYLSQPLKVKQLFSMVPRHVASAKNSDPLWDLSFEISKMMFKNKKIRSGKR